MSTTETPMLDLIYKEVKSMNQRLEFLEDLAEELIVMQLPKGRLNKSQTRELKKRIKEMKSGEKTGLE